MDKPNIGKIGEEIAAKYLKRKGAKILSRNFFLRAAHGPKIAEIDIIAQKSGVFLFVEVKTVKFYPKLHFLPQDKVDAQKLWKISKAAEFWLIKNKIPLNVRWQIDVIAVELQKDNRPEILKKLLGAKFKLSHFENVD